MSAFPFQVNGSDCPTPSKFDYSLQDLSAANSGRTQDGLMHKNKVAQKVKIKLQWNGVGSDAVAQILQMFDEEYFNVTYHDSKSNSTVTKTFYRGDAEAHYYWWVGDGLYESVAFDIIER